jgi:hypothetical protein
MHGKYRPQERTYAKKGTTRREPNLLARQKGKLLATTRKSGIAGRMNLLSFEAMNEKRTRYPTGSDRTKRSFRLPNRAMTSEELAIRADRYRFVAASSRT